MFLVHVLLVQYLLFQFFPWPGPGTIATVPASIILAFIIGVLHFFLINFIKKKSIRIFSQCFSFLFLTYFYLLNYGEEPLDQFSSAFYYSKYEDELKYEDIFGDNYGKYGVKYAAALAKYKDTIPDAGYVITYCCNGQKSFYIAKYGEVFKTNNKNIEIEISQDKKTITLIEIFDGETYTFKGSYNAFGKDDQWGRYGNMSRIKNSIYFDKVDFKANEGFCDVYYNYLTD